MKATIYLITLAQTLALIWLFIVLTQGVDATAWGFAAFATLICVGLAIPAFLLVRANRALPIAFGMVLFSLCTVLFVIRFLT